MMLDGLMDRATRELRVPALEAEPARVTIIKPEQFPYTSAHRRAFTDVVNSIPSFRDPSCSVRADHDGFAR